VGGKRVAASSDAMVLDESDFGRGAFEIMTADPGGCGILYVATGQKYLDEAAHSARSVRRVSPELPLAIVCDGVPSEQLFDVRLRMTRPEHSFIDKIGALARTPFERTLFLDTDTFAMRPLADIFELLQRFEIAAAAEPGRYLYEIEGVSSAFPELNTGVLLYRRNEAVLDLIADWEQLYRDEIASKVAAGVRPWHDQLSFTRAIYNSKLSFFMLPPEFNTRVLMPQMVSGPIRICHCRMKRPDRYQKELGRLNESINPRNINPNPRRIPEIVARTFSLFLTLRR
jgi:hypothetical protein